MRISERPSLLHILRRDAGFFSLILAAERHAHSKKGINADFKGRDQAQLEAFFSNGASIKTTYYRDIRVTIRNIVESGDKH